MTTLRVSICGIAGLFFVGCATTLLDETGTVDSGSEPSDTDADTDSEDSGGGDTGTPTQGDARTLSGTIQWTVDFDAEAEALGFTDCAYTREYAGIEDKSQPWLCPECAVVYRVDATVIDGLDDCFSQIATDPSPTEWLGWTAEGVFRRSGRENYLMSDQGSAAVSTDSVTTQHAITLDLPDGGQFAFDIQGAFVRAKGDGDVFHGYTPPNEYACGWPKSGAPEFTGAYALRQGQALPDAVMMDRCEDPVRLHDFSGQYLVIDISAVNCPPCRSMAQQEPEFAQKMKEDGFDIEMVTLLAPSLSSVLSPTSTEILTAWTEEYQLDGPVLADRGYGYWLGNDALESFAYPTWILVAPDLTVFELGTGFSNFDGIEASIRAYDASR